MDKSYLKICLLTVVFYPFIFTVMIDEIRLSFNNGILYSLFIAVFFELFSPSFHSASTD